MGKGCERGSSGSFKWLRRLINRLRFRHSKFKDGKYTKRHKDIEKWRDDSSLTSADYPDYRWQVVTKGKAKRMVPSMIETEPDKPNDHPDGHHHHSHGEKCACQTLKELGMVHYEPRPQKAGVKPAKRTVKAASTASTPTATTEPETKATIIGPAEANTHHHHHDSDHKCACKTLQELGMVWYEPKSSKAGTKPGQSAGVRAVDQRVVLAQMHGTPTVEELLSDTMKEIRIGKESIHQRLKKTPLYKSLDENDEVSDEYPHLKKSLEARNQQGNVVAGSRYVPLPSVSSNNQDGIQLDLTEVTVPEEPVTMDKVDSVFDPFSNEPTNYHDLQAESENDKNHLKSVKGFKSENSKQEKIKNNTKKAVNSPRKSKTPKHRRSLKQRAERKLRKYSVPKGYKKLKEEDVDEDIMKIEQDLNVKKDRRKQLKKQNVPEWMIAEETLVLRPMNAAVPSIQSGQSRNHCGTMSQIPRGSPSAKRGSPRHILYQMQMQKAANINHNK